MREILAGDADLVVRGRITHLGQQVTDPRLRLEERDQDLTATRAANRELHGPDQHPRPPAERTWYWLACRVLLKVVYVLTCRVLGLAVLVFRGDRAKDAELLVLRRENAVLRRHAGRVRYERADRAWFAALGRLVPRRRRAGVFPVTPVTPLAWHRRLAAGKYDIADRTSLPRSTPSPGPPAPASCARPSRHRG